MESAEEKKKQFEAHLQEQSRARLLQQQQLKQQKNNAQDPQEHMLFIRKQYLQLAAALQSCIGQYKKKQVTYLQLQHQFSLLKAYIVKMSYAMNTFDRQLYKEAADKYTYQIQEARKNVQPRISFKFTRRQEDFGVKGETYKQTQLVITKETPQSLAASDMIPGVDGVANLTNISNHVYSRSDSKDSQVGPLKVVNCTNSSITLLQPTEILFLKNLKGVKLNCAATKSTVFIDRCVDCHIQVSCHQLRIHNSTGCTFSIFVTSKAIIEDCNGITFEQYTFDYPDKQTDFINFDRTNRPNQWKDIQDFNWLKDNMQSPHYQLKE